MDKPKRESILDLSRYINERIRVKFTGGREGKCCCSSTMTLTHLSPVTGILKGYDQLLNLVLDNVEEQIQGETCIIMKWFTLSKAFDRTRASHSHVRIGRLEGTYDHAAKSCGWFRRNSESIYRVAIALLIFRFLYIVSSSAPSIPTCPHRSTCSAKCTQ